LQAHAGNPFFIVQDTRLRQQIKTKDKDDKKGWPAQAANLFCHPGQGMPARISGLLVQ
jgi:hypothetical protein